jgi:Fic family protein
MTFDPQSPNNSLLFISEARIQEISEDIEIIKYLNEANKRLFKLEKAINSIPNPKILLDFISIPESVASNAVENIHTTVDEAFQAEAINDPSKISKATKETLHYKEALLYGYNQIKTRGGITVLDIKKMNSIIVWYESDFYSSPWKKIETSSKETLYTPPQWTELINKLMDNFCEYFNKKELIINWESEDILLLAPILHYQFEAIHPFGDGNGRVWRILLVLFLTLHGILSYPVLFLSQYIHKYKTDYYSTLRGMDSMKKWSLKELSSFILLIMMNQWTLTEITVLEIQVLQQKIKNELKKWSDLKRISEIMDFLFMKPYYSVDGLSIFMKIHRNTASTYLAKFVELGFINEEKVGRNKLFYFPEYFELLIKESR